MAAQTAVSVVRENLGSLTLHIFTFSAVTGTDTFASGLPNVVSYWAQATDTSMGTAIAREGVNVSNSSGTFTFAVGQAAIPVTLFVVSKS
jgi:hypothetical protein